MMWFNFLRVLTFNYSTTHTFFCSNKLISREVLAYKFLGIGKQNTTYLSEDILNLNKKPIPTKLKKTKRKKVSLKKPRRPLKSLYFPGLYLLNQDYNIDFRREFIFFVFRFFSFCHFYYNIKLKNLFSLFLNKKLVDFDLYSFFYLLYTEKKVLKFKYITFRALMLKRLENRRILSLRFFRRRILKRLKRRFSLKRKHRFLFIRKYLRRRKRKRVLKNKRRKYLSFKFKFRLHKRRKYLLRLRNRMLKLSKLKLLLLK